MSEDGLTRSKGVQSVEVGMLILKAFCRAQGAMSLSEIAQSVGIPPAKVHRYLASLVESGMVVQRKTGSYDLGRAAAEVGMAAVARYDVVNRAADLLPDVVEATDCTAMLSVWGTLGPTVVRWERSSPPLVTALGVGTLLPLITSATGLAFLAWSPERLAGDHLSNEEMARAQSLCADIRREGLAEARQSFIPGLYALAAPVLDLQGQAEAVVTLVSTEKDLLADDSPGRQALKRLFPVGDYAVPGTKWSPVR
ncbi:MAG: IclR family transcriptional regulator [Cohaesibacteraceae bacterium]